MINCLPLPSSILNLSIYGRRWKENTVEWSWIYGQEMSSNLFLHIFLSPPPISYLNVHTLSIHLLHHSISFEIYPLPCYNWNPVTIILYTKKYLYRRLINHWKEAKNKKSCSSKSKLEDYSNLANYSYKSVLVTNIRESIHQKQEELTTHNIIRANKGFKLVMV